jgi:hypothetical protein
MATVYKYPQWLMPENSNQEKVSNYSFAFDGVDDYVDTGAIDLGETNTISFWFKNNSANTGNAIIGDANDNVVYFQSSNLFYYPTGSITGRKLFSSTNISSAMSDTTNWHNIIFIRKAPTNGTNGYNDLACYLDGNLEGTFADVYTANINLIPVYIGKSGTGFPLYEGLIDEVSYYDNDQTANVSTIYNSGVPTTITGAVAHYKMSEQATFTDNWLVNNSALSNYSTRSFSFDGVDDYVNCGNSITNLQTGDISFSAWIYPTSFSSYNYFLDSGAITTKKGIFAGLQITTGFVALARKTAVTDTRCNTGWVDCGLTINNWYNIVGVYDEDGGTAGVGQLKLYVNGVLKATVDGSGQDTGTGYDLYIGKSENNFSHFIGNIDEVSFYDYPLTSGNVTTIYNSGSPANLTSLSPTSWWRMGEDATFSTNWSLPDNGSGSNTGTSANMDLADLEGEAPNYTGSGLSANMTIEDRVGNAPNSNNNAVSYNMTESDRVAGAPN